MGRYEAILFDFDGVLADTEPVHFACWAEILKPFGIQLGWPTYQKYCVGLHEEKMVEFFSGLRDPPLRVDDVWALYPRKSQLFLERMVTAPPFPESTVTVLKSLFNYKLAVVTSSGRCEIEPVLEAGGIRSCFEAAVYGEDVKRHKPAPDPYLLAAKRLGITSALVVEDSEAGVESGRAAGFEVVRISDPAETAALVLAALAT